MPLMPPQVRRVLDRSASYSVATDKRRPQSTTLATAEPQASETQRPPSTRRFGRAPTLTSGLPMVRATNGFQRGFVGRHVRPSRPAPRPGASVARPADSVYGVVRFSLGFPSGVAHSGAEGSLRGRRKKVEASARRIRGGLWQTANGLKQESQECSVVRGRRWSRSKHGARIPAAVR